MNAESEEAEMKESKYNIISQLDDGSALLFNSLSGNLIRMENKQYKEYLDIVHKISPPIGEEIPANGLINQLKQGCFIVEDEFDEFNYIKAQHNMKRYMPDLYHLVIEPTSACNMACAYCFHGSHIHGTMSREIEERLAETVKKVFVYKNKLNVTWTGGEPTLAIDTIYRLSRRFMEIARERNASYTSGILTNGYLLNEKTAERLKECGLGYVQITMDGPPEIHNKRRPLKNGTDTFDTIMKNLKGVSRMFPTVLRVNIDIKNANTEHINKLLDIMEQMEIPRHVTIDYGFVHARTPACGCYGATNRLEWCEYAQKLIELLYLVLARGYNFIYNALDLSTNYAGCPSCGNDCLAISSEGDICKCLMQFGDRRESLGNLLSDEHISSRITKWLTWDPFARKECRECQVLPICMGGCPYLDASVEGNCRDELRCAPIRFEMQEILKLHYKKIRGFEAAYKNQQANGGCYV